MATGDEAKRHYVKCNQSITEEEMLDDSLCEAFKQSSRSREQDHGYQGDGLGSYGNLLFNAYKVKEEKVKIYMI